MIWKKSYWCSKLLSLLYFFFFLIEETFEVEDELASQQHQSFWQDQAGVELVGNINNEFVGWSIPIDFFLDLEPSFEIEEEVEVEGKPSNNLSWLNCLNPPRPNELFSIRPPIIIPLSLSIEVWFGKFELEPPSSDKELVIRTE